VNIPGVTEGPTVPGHEKCPLSSIPFLESIFIDLVKKRRKRNAAFDPLRVALSSSTDAEHTSRHLPSSSQMWQCLALACLGPFAHPTYT
jgi:hypothetical protein